MQRSSDGVLVRPLTYRVKSSMSWHKKKTSLECSQPNAGLGLATHRGPYPQPMSIHEIMCVQHKLESSTVNSLTYRERILGFRGTAEVLFTT